MEGFDDPGVFFSDNFGADDNQDDQQINRQQIKNRLREFIRQFHEGNFTYTYRLEWVILHNARSAIVSVPARHIRACKARHTF